MAASAAGQQPAPPWFCPWASGELVLQCAENLLLSFFTELGVFRLVSVILFSFLSHSRYTAFLPFLKDFITPLASLISSVLAICGSPLEAAGTDSVQHD